MLTNPQSFPHSLGLKTRNLCTDPTLKTHGTPSSDRSLSKVYVSGLTRTPRKKRGTITVAKETTEDRVFPRTLFILRSGVDLS